MSWSPGSELKQSKLQARTGLSRPPRGSTTDLKWAVVCQELSLVRSSVLSRNRRRAPGRSIIPIKLHHKSLKAPRAGERRRVGGPAENLILSRCSLSPSGRDEDSSSAALSPLFNTISCYDMVPASVGHVLIRCFLLKPVRPQLSPSPLVDFDVTC